MLFLSIFMLLDPNPHSQYGSGSTTLAYIELSGPTFYSIVPLLEMDEGVVLDLLDSVHFPEGLEALPAHSNATVLHPKITIRITGRPPHELSVLSIFSPDIWQKISRLQNFV